MMEFRCDVCDESFEGFIPCREHIITYHRAGFDNSGENELTYRKNLTLEDLDWVDSKVMVISTRKNDRSHEMWTPLNQCYSKVYPFSERKTSLNVPRGEGAKVRNYTVYVAQMRPIQGDCRHVYVGYTSKSIDDRYMEHVEGYWTGSKKFRDNMFSKDPCNGLRWDIFYQIHDHEEGFFYADEDEGRGVEGWLHEELERLGYVVIGDKGKRLKFKRKSEIRA